MYGLLVYLLSGVILAQTFRIEYFASRFFSILSLTLLSFILSFIFPFKIVFYLSFLLFLGIGIFQIKRNGFNFDFHSETAFLLTFLLFLFLRSLDPAAYGAEKLMDYAFMNSVLNAQKFHPPDPFYAQGTLNFYYYFGYVIGAGIVLMSFVPPEIGFNVAIASIPAYFVMLGFGLLKSILNSSLKGVAISTIFISFSGNLYAVYELLRDAFSGKLPGFLYYWNASRIIDDATYGKTINEFPYFSFIHADYHAHFVALPIKLLALFFLYRYVEDRKFGFYMIPVIFILFATNSWDAPIFIFITALIVILRFKEERRRSVLEGFGIISISLLSILFLYSTMQTPAAKPFFTSERTSIDQFMLYFGIIVLLNYLYLWKEFKSMFGVVSFILGFIAYTVSPIMPIIIPLTLVSLRKFLRGDFNSVLTLSASILILSCEFIAIESRLNTFFKFYLAAWVLLSIPAAICIGKTLSNNALSARAKYLVALLLILSLVYPIIATPVRYYKAEFSLDSSNFIKEISEDDYNAIRFLRDKRGVVVESAEGCYSYEGRVSAFTANPTILAWSCHEVQWRGNPRELGKRMAEVRAIYKSNDCKALREIVKKYNVSYIFLGYQERKDYGINSLRCFKEIYRSGNTIVYAANFEIEKFK
jgi:YYY domain-containing protein